jgi:hypothetical protein
MLFGDNQALDIDLDDVDDLRTALEPSCQLTCGISEGAESDEQRLGALDVHRTYLPFTFDEPREPQLAPSTADLRHALDLMADFGVLMIGHRSALLR